LVGTIDSCGRTLLDTINHVLDFSKINSLKRSWRKDRTSRRMGRAGAVGIQDRSLSTQLPGVMSICGITDVAAVCEEVVEGIYAGQVYRDISPADITDAMIGSRARSAERGPHQSVRPSILTTEKPVEIILDIPYGDYIFNTQPGALRRVIMNIFGNALKYTEKGTISVRLGLDELERTATSGREQRKEIGKVLTITITDTGRGISQSYIRTRLFTRMYLLRTVGKSNC
jgi:signal transduction histidine kinase